MSGAPEVWIEKRRRGFFGWLFLLVFIGWNVLMLLWMIAAMSQAGSNAAAGGVAFVLILIVWALGSVVTGILALLTRGSKTVIRRQP